MRNLILFILVLAAIWWGRRALQRFKGGGDASRGGARRAGDAVAEPERMIGCARCGLHVPESESVREGDTFFCCEAHRRLGVKR